jgi:acetyltransferase-like isoleucine patch superfamily enzyme
MLKHSFAQLVTALVLLFGTAVAVPQPVVRDVNDVSVSSLGGGQFAYIWGLGGAGAGFSQLEPGESYTLDVEFLDGQFFDVIPLLAGDETIELVFGSQNGPAIVDPGLVLSSGSLDITGLIGDLDVPHPVALNALGFVGNFDGLDQDFLTIGVTDELTSDGFSFHDLHFSFTLDNIGDTYPMNGGQLLLVIIAGGQEETVPVASDLWDLSQGTVVTSHSGVLEVSDIRNMFGGMFGPIGPYTLFEDGLPAGTIHSVEWQTAQQIVLTSFNLFANHDGLEFGATHRGFSAFRLFAQNPVTLNFDLLAEIFPSDPYDDTPGNMASDGFLVMSIDVAPTVAQVFRAEFVQFGDIEPAASGPRVQELDGFGTIPGVGTEIDKGVSIGDNVNIGDFVLIKKDADIGDNVSVGSNTTINKEVVIGDNVMIGDNVVIDRNVVIEDGVTIGNDTTIKQGVLICSGATIGSVVTIGKNRRVDTGENVPDGIVWNGSKTPPPACTP